MCSAVFKFLGADSALYVCMYIHGKADGGIAPTVRWEQNQLYKAQMLAVSTRFP